MFLEHSEYNCLPHFIQLCTGYTNTLAGMKSLRCYLGYSAKYRVNIHLRNIFVLQLLILYLKKVNSQYYTMKICLTWLVFWISDSQYLYYCNIGPLEQLVLMDYSRYSISRADILCLNVHQYKCTWLKGVKSRCVPWAIGLTSTHRDVASVNRYLPIHV